MYFVRIYYESFRLLDSPVYRSLALWPLCLKELFFSFFVCFDPPYFTVVDFCFCFVSRLSIAS